MICRRAFTLYEMILCMVLVSALSYGFVNAFQVVNTVYADLRIKRHRLHELNLFHQHFIMEAYRGGKLKLEDSGHNVLIQRLDERTKILSKVRTHSGIMLKLGYMNEVNHIKHQERNVLHLDAVHTVTLQVLQDNILNIMFQFMDGQIVQLNFKFSMLENNMTFRRVS